MNLETLYWLIPVGSILLVLITLAIPVLVLRPFISRWRMKKELMQSGIDASATIIRTWDTGVHVNRQPQIGMLLEVRPPYGAPYQAEIKEIVPHSQLPLFQPGANLRVKCDPSQPDHVAIIQVAAGGAMAGSMINAQQAEQMLMGFQAKNEQLLQSGWPAPAKVLQYMPMGINVNGNNPAVSLLVEVYPNGGAPFIGQVQGVIAETSVPKYQPGQMISVRYDPNDQSKVTIERSGV